MNNATTAVCTTELRSKRRIILKSRIRCDFTRSFISLELFRICCNEFVNQVLMSSLNPAPIVSFNSHYFSRFKISYRYVGVTTPQPTTTSAPKTTQNDCFDLSGDHCRRYIENNGDCSRLSEEDAKKYCKKSCGYC